MHANDPSSGLVTRAVLSDAGYGEVARHALERVQFDDEVTPFGWMVKRRLAALSLSESTGGKPERALRYREVMVPLGVEHELRGVLVLDRAGRVVQHTGAAERRLEELGDLGPGWREGDGLPSAILSMTGALRRALGPEADREGRSVPRLLVRARSGRWLVLHGAWTEPGPEGWLHGQGGPGAGDRAIAGLAVGRRQAAH